MLAKKHRDALRVVGLEFLERALERERHGPVDRIALPGTIHDDGRDGTHGDDAHMG